MGENLRLGGYLLRKEGSAYHNALDRVLGIFEVLGERWGQTAGTLSGGQQQMLAIARALMSGPRILLVDEASLGLAPTIVTQLFRVFEELNREGMTLLVVEQSVGFALGYAHRAYVIQKGVVAFEGHAKKLGDRELLTAYLG